MPYDRLSLDYAMATKTENKASRNARWSFVAALPLLLTIGGLIGLGASFALTIEKYDALKDPQATAVCDLNPIFSCSSVSSSAQAELFGFPNPVIGLAGYAAVATIGVAMLAGAVFRRWFWLAVQAGLTLAVIFIHWLIFQTLYDIGALCLFCMIAWVATIPSFWYVTLYNLKQSYIKTPESMERIVSFAYRHHGDILLAWFVIIAALIAKRFWYYWSSLF